MTLDQSAGIDLYKISPHRSDNSHTELYETMFSEYALSASDITDWLKNHKM
nr:MAG TPA: hypothetical protein [Caudoviricetes sp.]